jgi:hypothetical protein
MPLDTTIKLSNETKEKLKIIKRLYEMEHKRENFNDVIEFLIEEFEENNVLMAQLECIFLK